MAKKAGALQLQIDITTDEELYKFLEHEGLCHVYSEWCGPCIAMQTTLRKAKVEHGGESLFLATCRADTIDALARFRVKSEPTWLFCTRKRLVNIVFGCKIPKLWNTLQIELHKVLLSKPFPDAVRIHEYLPIEKEKIAKIQEAQEKARLQEEREFKKKRLDHLNYCTGEILSYLPGYGVTLFGPQVNRDILKKILEAGETENISCKDKKGIILQPENIEVLHYACNNPINEDALEQMYDKELLVAYWKIPEGNNRSVEEIMGSFVAKLTKPSDDGDEKPPMLQSLEIKIKPEKTESIKTEPKDDVALQTDEQEEEEEEEEEVVEEEQIEENFESHASIMVKKSSSYLYMVTVPAMWTPGNKRTTAAAIYTFFRNQTTAFLEPDRVPDPPHLIVVFDAWKRKDVTDVMNKYSDEILTYGYFTSEEPEKAALIANSTSAYSKQKANRLDKLVVKVAKVKSHAVLALASHSPVYVSPNTDIGKIEALKFFPEGYSNDEPAPTPTPAPEPEPETTKTKTPAKHKSSKEEEHKETVATSNEVTIKDEKVDAPVAEGDAPAGEIDAHVTEDDAPAAAAEEPPAE